MVHTADWHLGKKLLGYDRLEEQARFVDSLFDFVREESIDAMLVAGDIFDRSVPPVEALQLFGDFLERMVHAKCPVVAISGNHDSAERLGFARGLLEKSGVYLCTQVARAFEPIAIGPLDVFALPFADSHLLASAVEQQVGQELEKQTFREHGAAVEAYVNALPARSDRPRLLLAHLFCVGGIETPESERPISSGGVGHVSPHVFADFDYVALGHLHRAQRVAGRDHVRYAGSPLQYSVSEHSHDKSINVVTIDASGEQVRVDIEDVQLYSGRKVVLLKERFEALLTSAEYDRHRDDFVAAFYSDETYVLNAAQRLQERFPFLLQALSSRVAEAAKVHPARAAADAPRELLCSFWSYARIEHELEEAHHDLYERTLQQAQAQAGQDEAASEEETFRLKFETP